MSLVRLEREDGVAIVTLARPAAGNALVPELLAGLLDTLQTIEDDASIRAVVLRAEGTAFSLGGDMRRFAAELAGGDLPAYAQHLVGELNRAILALLDLTRPVIAAVQGPVTGGALGLVLASDLVYLSPGATLKAHYATAGFAPDGGWTALLPQIAGSHRAAACLLMNRTISSQEAVTWGMANELVPPELLDAVTLEAAAKIARYPAGTMRAAKRLLGTDRASLAQRLEAERLAFVAQIQTAEARRGIAAFLDAFTGYPPGDIHSKHPKQDKATPCT